jgi:hypothetical protein
MVEEVIPTALTYCLFVRYVSRISDFWIFSLLDSESFVLSRQMMQTLLFGSSSRKAGIYVYAYV